MAAGDCRSRTFYLFMQRRSAKPTPSKTPGGPAVDMSRQTLEKEGGATRRTGNLQHRHRNTTMCVCVIFYGTKTTSFLCAPATSSICEQKNEKDNNKKRQLMERKHIFILLYRRDTHGTKTLPVLRLHVYTQTRCRESRDFFFSFFGGSFTQISSSWDKESGGGTFFSSLLYINIYI